MNSHDGGRLDDDERISWLQLAQSDNIGPSTFDKLLRQYGEATLAVRRIVEIAEDGGNARVKLYPRHKAERDCEVARRIGARLIAKCEPDYPPLLKVLACAPPVLFAVGRSELAARPCCAIVGSRNASANGLAISRRFARDLGRLGWTIVSGLARGIDTAAHSAALEAGTIAVVATGLDVAYPPQNRRLLDQVAAQGLVIGEMVPGTRPRAELFPRRNRIIAGISAGVLIVEAAVKSGSLITARLAGEMGRQVMAVPGSPTDPRSYGANHLIRDGATLVTSAADVHAEIGMQAADMGAWQDDRLDAAPNPASMPDDAHSRVLELLGAAPVAVDCLIREADLPASTVQQVLLELDLAGRLEHQPGQRVVLLN